MTREIKFRVWDTAMKKFVCSEYLRMRWDDLVTDVYDTFQDIEDETPNKQAILMQYTGLKDKNGKGREIYEGDVYKQDNRFYVVEWSEYSCGFVARNIKSRNVLPGYLQGEIAVYDDYEYVGCIYQSPELLKEE